MKNESAAVIAICDRETEYACHLGEYVKSGASFPVRIRIFTGAEKLLSILNPKETALLVIAESEYDDRMERAGFPAILLLNESGRFLDHPKNVSKYQSMDVLCGEIFSLCKKTCAEEAPSVHHGEPLQRIAFFTPCSRSLQTTLALTLSEVLSERGRVLYLNFEPFPAWSVFSPGTSQGSMRELLFTSDTDREKFAERLTGAAERIGSFDAVPPVPSFPELRKVKTCSRIFTITGEDSISQAKLAAYQALLKQEERTKIIAQTAYLQLPLFQTLPKGAADLGSGPVAAFVRRALSDGRR